MVEYVSYPLHCEGLREKLTPDILLVLLCGCCGLMIGTATPRTASIKK